MYRINVNSKSTVAAVLEFCKPRKRCIPLMTAFDNSADTLEQSVVTDERLLFLLQELTLLVHDRFLGPGLDDVTDSGGFGTITVVGTAVGCSLFFKSFKNMTG